MSASSMRSCKKQGFESDDRILHSAYCGLRAELMTLLAQGRLLSAQLFAYLRQIGVGLTPLRRVAVAAGVFSVLALAFVPEGITANRIALAALLLLAVAMAAGWIEFLLQRRDDEAVSPT